jgi:hypothetical protein
MVTDPQALRSAEMPSPVSWSVPSSLNAEMATITLNIDPVQYKEEAQRRLTKAMLEIIGCDVSQDLVRRVPGSNVRVFARRADAEHPVATITVCIDPAAYREATGEPLTESALQAAALIVNDDASFIMGYESYLYALPGGEAL